MAAGRVCAARGSGGRRLFAEARRGFELGVFASDVSVEGAQLVHVVSDVPRRRDVGAEAAALSAVVEEAEADGHAALGGDVVEAGLPVGRLAPRPLRREGQYEFVGGLEPPGHLRDEGLRLTPIDGYPAEPAEEPAPRRGEERVLAHPRGAHAEDVGGGQHEREIPVRRVGRGDDDAFSVQGDIPLDLPAEEAEPQPARPIKGRPQPFISSCLNRRALT